MKRTHETSHRLELHLCFGSQVRLSLLEAAETREEAREQEMIELALRYADAYSEPFEFELPENRIACLQPKYSRILFKNKPPWLDKDPEKHRRLEKLQQLLKRAQLTSPMFSA